MERQAAADVEGPEDPLWSSDFILQTGVPNGMAALDNSVAITHKVKYALII